MLLLLDQVFAEPGWLPVFLGGFVYFIGLFVMSVAVWRSGDAVALDGRAAGSCSAGRTAHIPGCRRAGKGRWRLVDRGLHSLGG